MISAVNFNGQVRTGHIDEKSSNKNEKVIVLDKPKEGFFRKSVNLVANTKKVYVATKEGFLGTIKAAAVGLFTGGIFMSMGWMFGKLSREKLDRTIITTPLKTAGNLIAATFKKAAGIFNKSFVDVIKYPVIDFPKDVYKYVKNAKCGKATKIMAVTVGFCAAAASAFGSIIKINRAMADIDHGYRVGHNR